MGDKKDFHSRLPKMFLTSDLHLVPEEVYKKRIVLKDCVKNHLKMFLIELCRIPHTCRKGLFMLL